MNTRKIRIALAMLVIAATLIGCRGNDAGNSRTGVSGLVMVAGSSALQPLVERAAREFQNKNPGATISVQGGGSGTGLTQVIQGAVDIGNSDIYAEDKRGIDSSQLVDNRVCAVGFVIITNKNVKIDNLSQSQLIDIFTGKITNWKQVGGNDLDIVVINRPKSSGTRITFKKYALNNSQEVEGISLTQDSSGAIIKAIQSNKGAIGYLALPYLTEENRNSVKTIKFNGIEANNDNIITGKYTIWSYEHMYTKDEPNGLTRIFIDYMSSEGVESIIRDLGYIPIGDMKVKRD